MYFSEKKVTENHISADVGAFKVEKKRFHIFDPQKKRKRREKKVNHI